MKNGYIAFLDILGYSSFLENCRDEDSAKFVVDLIVDSEKTFSEPDTKLLSRNIFDSIYSNIRIISFSDTIVLLLDCDTMDSKSSTAFILAVRTLSRTMFYKGLPLRGWVKYGQYYEREKSFAGIDFNYLYEQGQAIDLSGIGIEDDLMDDALKFNGILFDKDDVYHKLMNLFFIKYLCPLKNGTEKHIKLVNFYDDSKKSNDIAQLVYGVFVMHGKDVSMRSSKKYDNTVQFLRYCLCEVERVLPLIK